LRRASAPSPHENHSTWMVGARPVDGLSAGDVADVDDGTGGDGQKCFQSSLFDAIGVDDWSPLIRIRWCGRCASRQQLGTQPAEGLERVRDVGRLDFRCFDQLIGSPN